MITSNNLQSTAPHQGCALADSEWPIAKSKQVVYRLAPTLDPQPQRLIFTIMAKAGAQNWVYEILSDQTYFYYCLMHVIVCYCSVN